MIVRILSEGQFNLPGACIDELNEIDNQMVAAVESEDAASLCPPAGGNADPGAGKGRAGSRG